MSFRKGEEMTFEEWIGVDDEKDFYSHYMQNYSYYEAMKMAFEAGYAIGKEEATKEEKKS